MPYERDEDVPCAQRCACSVRKLAKETRVEFILHEEDGKVKERDS